MSGHLWVFANSGSPASGSKTLTWLRKCTSKVFVFSAGKKDEHEAGETQAQEKLVDVGEIPEYILSSEDEPEVSAKVASDSFNIQRQVEQSGDDLRNINSQAHEIEEVSQQLNGNEVQNKPTTRRRPRATRARATKAASENTLSAIIWFLIKIL